MVSPLMEGSEVRGPHWATHDGASEQCSIYYGKCTEHWVRMRLLDLMKVPAGRTDPHLAQASGSLPRDATQGEVARHAGSVLNGIADPGPTTLEPFLARLEGRARAVDDGDVSTVQSIPRSAAVSGGRDTPLLRGDVQVDELLAELQVRDSCSHGGIWKRQVVLVTAGLLPALQGGLSPRLANWRIASLRPGAIPSATWPGP